MASFKIIKHFLHCNPDKMQALNRAQRQAGHGQVKISGRNMPWKMIWLRLQKLNIELPQDPAVPLVGICPGEMKTCLDSETYLHTDVYSHNIIKAKSWKQLKFP